MFDWYQSKESQSLSSSSWYWLVVFVVSLCFNPFIYAFRSTNFKEGFKRVILCRNPQCKGTMKLLSLVKQRLYSVYCIGCWPLGYHFVVLELPLFRYNKLRCRQMSWFPFKTFSGWPRTFPVMGDNRSPREFLYLSLLSRWFLFLVCLSFVFRNW